MRSYVDTHWYTIVLTLLTVNCLVITSRGKARQKWEHVYLSVMAWSSWYVLTAAMVTMTDLANSLPHIIRTGHIATLIFMPASFLYVRQTLEPARAPKAKDLLHLLPVFLYLVDYMPFFLKSGKEKLAILHGLDAGSLLYRYDEGWLLPPYVHSLIREMLMLFYWTIQVRLIKGMFTKKQASEQAPDRQLKRWLYWLSSMQLFIILPTALVLFMIWFWSSHGPLWMSQIFPFLGTLAIGLYLVFHPDLFYGVGKRIQVMDSEIDQNNDPQENPDRKPLPKERFSEIGNRLESWAGSTNAWLDPGFRLADLARETGVSTHHISAYLNSVLGTNFNDYVNEKRVGIFIAKATREARNQKTLEALAQESGFSNRATFIRAFKKIMGVTPSQYMQDDDLRLDKA